MSASRCAALSTHEERCEEKEPGAAAERISKRRPLSFFGSLQDWCVERAIITEAPDVVRARELADRIDREMPAIIAACEDKS